MDRDDPAVRAVTRSALRGCLIVALTVGGAIAFVGIMLHYYL